LKHTSTENIAEVVADNPSFAAIEQHQTLLYITPNRFGARFDMCISYEVKKL